MCALILTDITFVNKTSHGIFSDLIILYVFAESTNTVRSYFTDDWGRRIINSLDYTIANTFFGEFMIDMWNK